LADFGLAKMEHTSRASRPNLTLPGQVLGTMAYAAPEQIQEGPIDSRVDIYSLGIVLYELLTGKLPFEGETAFDFLMARLTDPPLPLLEANPNVPPVFGPIIEKALTKNVAERYQKMGEMSEDLRRVRDQLRQITRLEAAPQDETSLVQFDTAKEPEIRLKIVTSGLEIVPKYRSELTIGRSYKNIVPDIDLGPYGGSKAGVSRRHSRLLFKNMQWYIEDLASTNGTFVNNIKIAPHQLVAFKNGDTIRCGQIELKLKVD